MTAGIATCASNALALDYHLEEFVKWHAPKADKLVINVDVACQDDTYPVLRYLQRHYPSLELLETDWGDQKKENWLGEAKTQAWKKLKGCQTKILLDIDEFILEQDINQAISEKKAELAGAEAPVFPERWECYLYPLEYIHLVGSWRVRGSSPEWPDLQWRITVSGDVLDKHVNLDKSGSNLIGVEPWRKQALLRVLHMGCVRDRKKLLEKWQRQMQRNLKRDSHATSSWQTAADGDVKLSPIEPGVVPSFFKTPDFDRTDGEILKCSL